MLVNTICWGISILLLIIFVLMILSHMIGYEDYSLEISLLFKMVIYALSISLIVFLISQHVVDKHIEEQNQKIEYHL